MARKTPSRPNRPGRPNRPNGAKSTTKKSGETVPMTKTKNAR